MAASDLTVSSHMHALGNPPGPIPQITGIGPGALSLAATTAWEITLTGADRQGAIDLARLALSGDTLDGVDQGFIGAVARNVLEVAEASPPNQWDNALAKAYRRATCSRCWVRRCGAATRAGSADS